MLDPKNIGPGEEQHEYYTDRSRKKRCLCQYDYRASDGELFSCIKLTLDACRAARNEWLERRNK